MTRTILYSLLLGVAGLALWTVGTPSVAKAQGIQSTLLVDSASITLEPNARFEDQRLYVGIDQCRTLVEDNPWVTVNYRVLVDIITDATLFGGAFFRRYERGDENEVSCRNTDGDLHPDCTSISNDDVTFSAEADHIRLEARVRFQEITGVSNPDDCEGAGIDQTHYFQLRVRDYASTGLVNDYTEWQMSEAVFILDLVRPDPPALSDTLVTPNSVRVEFDRSSSSDVRRHLVVYSSQPFEGGALLDDLSGMSTPRAVEGESSESGQVSATLEPGETVYVGVVARDHADNFSVVSDPMEATVQTTRGFWDFYVGSGGDEEGGYGCQNVGGTGGSTTILAVLAMMMVVGVSAWRRREERERMCNSHGRGRA